MSLKMRKEDKDNITVTGSHIHMNTSTTQATSHLKDIIQGKSKNTEHSTKTKRRMLKERITKLSVSNEIHRNRLNRLRQKINEQIVTKHHRDRPQQEPATDTDRTSPASTESASNNPVHGSMSLIELPPTPTTYPVPKPPCADSTNIDLPSVLDQLLQSSTKLAEPLFQFEVSDKAAAFNMKLLKDNKFDLGRLLNKEPSITSYGSELKAVDELEPLLRNHPRWSELKTRLTEGATFPVQQLEDSIRLQDIQAMKKRGNHKSAQIHEEYLSETFVKEVEKGWNLILPDNEALNIPGLELAPMGVADQLGISATGEFVSKLRVTHDLSFPQAVSKESLNSRVDGDQLQPCMFGHTLLRLVHHIVFLRNKYPGKRIWLRKEDFKSAYRRMHLNAQTALQASVRVKLNGKYYILVSLRLPFGGSPCPSDFCLVSDIITDTINDLLACGDWDPTTVKSDYVKNIPKPKPLPDNVPFAPARSLSVNLETEPCAKADCFVDDILSMTIDEGDNLLRLATAPCTVIHAMAHRTRGKTYLRRQDLISAEKNEAEGAPEEIKLCLGWEFNTRSLTIALPLHKYEAWDSQIESILKAKSVRYKLLESVLGRLENVAIIVKMFGHFLNNIRSLQIKATSSQHNQQLSKNSIAEFELSRKFLARARRGVSMNNIVFRKPNRIHIGDASEHGLGGMCTQNGKAWRFLIPTHLQGRAHINLLEFLI